MWLRGSASPNFPVPPSHVALIHEKHHNIEEKKKTTKNNNNSADYPPGN